MSLLSPFKELFPDVSKPLLLVHIVVVRIMGVVMTMHNLQLQKFVAYLGILGTLRTGSVC
jgi:hypothetical protein